MLQTAINWVSCDRPLVRGSLPATGVLTRRSLWPAFALTTLALLTATLWLVRPLPGPPLCSSRTGWLPPLPHRALRVLHSLLSSSLYTHLKKIFSQICTNLNTNHFSFSAESAIRLMSRVKRNWFTPQMEIHLITQCGFAPRLTPSQLNHCITYTMNSSLSNSFRHTQLLVFPQSLLTASNIPPCIPR